MSQRAIFDILGGDKEAEILQSFVRVGIKAEEDEEEPKRSLYAAKRVINQESDTQDSAEKPRQRSRSITKSEMDGIKKRKPRDYYSEVYTDKDRAAAVSAGSYDIKQSLKIKRQQDRQEALLIPEEADAASLITLGTKEAKNGNIESAVNCFSKVKRRSNIIVPVASFEKICTSPSVTGIGILIVLACSLHSYGYVGWFP